MGFFKQVKDMKAMVAEAPGLMEQSAQLAEQAQAQQLAAQQAAADAAAAASAPTTPDAPGGEA